VLIDSLKAKQRKIDSLAARLATLEKLIFNKFPLG
jgi:hypothetical protein